MEAAIIAAIISAALALTLFVFNQRLASLERRRRACADALAEALQWLELPYRIRRRINDEPETLTALVERIHALQERLLFHESWLQVEVGGAYEQYRDLVRGVKAASHDHLRRAWDENPKVRPNEMNLGGPPAPDVSDLRKAFCAAVRRISSAGRFGDSRMVMTTSVQPRSAAIEARFAAFRDHQVDLSPGVTKAGRDLRDGVIECLEQMSGVAGFPDLLVGHSFGAGSFGRRTKEQPLDDIDIYMVMSGGGLRMFQGGTPAPVELVGSQPGVLATDPGLVQGAWVSSALILARVVSHLSQLGYPSSANDKAKSAYIKVGDVNVDICPVVWGRFTIAEVDRYYLPAGYGSHAWTKTNPKLDQARLTNENQRHDGLLLPIIRIMKWWNDNCNDRRLKGIHLEVITANALRGVGIDGVAPTLHWLFARLQTYLDQECPDPTGLGAALDSTLEPAKRAASKATLGESQRIAALAAAHAAEGNTDLAIATWRRLFPL